jgi:hypothetical protein
MALEANMDSWLLMGWIVNKGNAHEGPPREGAAAAQKLDVHIPWLVALASILVVGMGLCMAVALIGPVLLHLGG